jgi:hypothetical protein
MKMYGKPSLAASLSIAFEATGWKGAGTVSRSRDQPDKTLQDFIVTSVAFQELLRKSCLTKKYMLLEILKETYALANKNIASGEIFLLYINAYTSCTISDVDTMDKNALEATKLAVKQGLKDYLFFLSLHKPSFYGRFAHSFYEKMSTSKTFTEITALAKNIPFDPVITEATTTFPFTRTLAKKLYSKLGCTLPSSDDIDAIYKSLCERYIDFLTYRKYGLEKAVTAKKKCIAGEEPGHSLGSIADLVSVVLYYYLNECLASRYGTLRRLGDLFSGPF